MVPEMFSPGIVSTGFNEFASVFSPDGSLFFYSMAGAPFPVLVMLEQNKGVWQEPRIAPFSGKYLDYDMNFTPDGKRLFFCSRRPVTKDEAPKKDTDIWYVERLANGWSQPKHLDYPLNSEASEYYPVFTRSGALYFSSTRKGGKGGADIYRSNYINGNFGTPQNLGDPINTTGSEGDLYVDLDEEYIIVTCYGRSDSLGSGDLYIAFRRKDGSWSQLVNMGPGINSPANEHCPMLTHDGKYLFFSSRRSINPQYFRRSITLEDKIKMMSAPGNGSSEDIYWVDARIIDKFKPKAVDKKD
jgi:Tol biopolymer transport system component